ncbi:tetratricopeptide repeat protein [Gaoshiqia sediminis]|uniref:Tetratricopeptide repeat protein n=1 Tax=Gaoshiqia sediminis TaxID=2986998 RepID=A0AA42C4Q6_9BACT|nr:tetratricopeptide repeat protein [Gaoshiqia sediminis]MCW0482028.1 tetratricopeptide repeat protein [Gaoshiqia sediminis]
MKRIFLVIVFFLGAYCGFAQDAAEMINKAQEALTAKDYAKAFELYENAMNNLGDVQVDAAINFNIGFAAFQADKYEAAIKYFEKSIAAEANVAGAYEYIGNSYAKLNKAAEAIQAYNKAIEAGSDKAGSLYYNAGIVAYKGNMLEQAVELFGKAVAENYNGETAMYYKAVSLKKLDKDEDYKQVLVEGAEKFPANDKITSALANVYVQEGNALYQKGVAIINAANEKVNAGTLKTTDAEYTAEIDKSKVEFKAALEILEKAKALDASNANAAKLIEACKAVI